jgi:hypothetical protein
MNLYEIIAFLLMSAAVAFLHVSTRRIISQGNKRQENMDQRLAILEQQVSAIPISEERIITTVHSVIKPLSEKIEAQSDNIAEVKSLLATVANKVGA